MARANRFAGVLLVVLSAFLVGCPRLGSGASRSAFSRTSPVRVTVLAPLTGRAKSLGIEVRRGARLGAAWEEEGLAPLSLRVTDLGDGGKRPGDAVEAIARDPKVVAAVGPVLSRAARTAAGEAASQGLPLIVLSSARGLPGAGKSTFRAFLTVERQARALAAHALGELAVTRVAILHPRTAYGQRMSRAFADEVRRRGGVVVARVSYRPSTRSFRSQARRLRRYRFGALLHADGYRAVSLAAGYLRAAGVGIGEALRRRRVWLLGTNEAHHPELLRRAGRALEGARFATGFSRSSSDLSTLFARAYSERYRKPPTFIAAFAFDAIRLARRAAAVAGGERGALSAALRETRLKGATGLLGFDADGEPVGTLPLVEVRGGHFRPLR